MQRQHRFFTRMIALAMAITTSVGVLASASTAEETVEKVRFATFNVSLYGNQAGELAQRLAMTDDSKAAAVAEIIQRVRPDVLLLNEIDYDGDSDSSQSQPAMGVVELLQKNYLGIGQNVSQSPEGPAEPIHYEYQFTAPSNTGMHSGHDLNRDGQTDDQPGTNQYAADCWGYGRYPGQYGMAILSRFPIDEQAVRTFRTFLWRDMPQARLPDNDQTETAADWYSAEKLQQFPLSSKSHWDVPILIAGRTIHVLASHPTPPVYDGPEDRNGRRNHDEIRFWVDYLTENQGDYIYDDRQVRGGLPSTAEFVVLGDLNSDPHDGQGSESISQLLAAARVQGTPEPESEGGEEQANLQGGVNGSHQGNPRHDTLDAADRQGPGNLRLDYVLPARGMIMVDSGVFWPHNKAHLFRLVGTYPFASSDHRLVWVDIACEPERLP